MAQKYIDGYYYGQTVICTAEDGPNSRPAYPKHGVIGKLKNYDPYDQTFLVQWPAGSYYPIIAESRGALDTWTRREFFKPYIPEVRRTEDGRRIDDFTFEIVEDESAEMEYLPEYGWILKSNIEKHIAKCAACGDWHKKEELVSVDCCLGTRYESSVKMICKDCLESNDEFYQCADCGRWFSRYVHDFMYRHTGEKLCPECSVNYSVCEECNEYWPIADIGHMRNDSRDLCPTCISKLKRKAIRPYSYKPNPKFKVGHVHDAFETDKNITELLMGVELEVDKGDDDAACANEIVENFDDVYCKHDGSLSRGIEIVSHPATLEYHLTELGWDRISEICRKWKFKSHEAGTCGLHVHVGRRQLGSNDAERDNTAGKLVLAMVRHWDNMVKFSRRKDSQLNWAECNKLYLEEIADECELIDAALETEDDGRYQAVNLCNSETVEFRIFRGTLEINTIKATLEFVSNICKYCKDHTPLEVMNSQWDDIAYYECYPELYDYLISRGLGNGQVSMLPVLPAWEYTEEENLTYNRKYKYRYDDAHPRVESGTLGHDTEHRVNDYSVGDYVLVVNRDAFYDRQAPVGTIGRVCCLSGDAVGVNFPYRFGSGHDLRGVLNEPNGYFIRPYHLMPWTAPRTFTIWAPCDEAERDDLSHLVDPDVVRGMIEPEFVF